MDGMFSQIKALNSEASLTSSQEQDQEPHHCFNDTCAYPFGNACSECRTAALEKEERRMELIEAKRAWKWIEDDELGELPQTKQAWRWIEDDDIGEPTGRTATSMTEEGREEGRRRWLEHSPAGPCLKSVESLRSLKRVSSTKSPLRSNQSVYSLRETLTSVPSLRSHQSSQSIENHPYRRRESFSSYSSQDTLVPEGESSEEGTTTSTEAKDTLQTQRWLCTLPSITDMANPFNPRLSALPSVSSMSNPLDPPQPQSCRTSIQSITSSILHTPAQQAQVTIRATPKLINIAVKPQPCTTCSSNSDLCPLCSRPIGDPTFQHLPKCQFAHEEKVRLDETMRRLKLSNT